MNPRDPELPKDSLVDKAAAALNALEDRVEGDLPPKENVASDGPRNLPVPSKRKKRRLTRRVSQRKNRSAKPSRRQRRRRVAPRGSRGS